MCVQKTVVQTLLDLGVDVNWSKENGETSLFLASEQGHASVVEVLLKEPGIDLKKGRDDSPLTVANWRQHETIVQLILHKYGRIPASKLKKKDTVDDVFRMTDVDSNSKISSIEISAILYEHFSKENRATYTNGNDILIKYDFNNDGWISTAELKLYLEDMANKLDLRLVDFIPLVVHELKDQGRDSESLEAFEKTKHPLGYADHSDEEM